MTLSELKKQANNDATEVHVLANEGDLYLVQVVHDGQESLLMERDQPMRFRSLAECSQTLASVGVKSGFMVQALPYDEMINTIDSEPHCDRLPINFH
ncbi:hypothetical protein CHH28_12720 [Bacterioplanes sanyensis]|uniref:Cation transporter n=1 Tax=Bacterioplanes sanyensis TaxID=1249553 RepID=A0A222FM70_9GAMM|nr:DUF6482 family protein [Bacterioplanes sanyensis]ASP39481.1 hypothetical protein CHH28_12720 [Bacterioplanes sanyensis]